MDLADCRALMGHTEWAESLVWQSVLALPQEDVELQAKLHHLHMVQWAYLHIWRGEAVKPRELGTFATRQALCDWAREYYRELPAYLAGLSDVDLGREVRFPWADRLVQRFGQAHPATWSRARCRWRCTPATTAGRSRGGCASWARSRRSPTTSPGSGWTDPPPTGATTRRLKSAEWTTQR